MIGTLAALVVVSTAAAAQPMLRTSSGSHQLATLVAHTRAGRSVSVTLPASGISGSSGGNSGFAPAIPGSGSGSSDNDGGPPLYVKRFDGECKEGYETNVYSGCYYAGNYSVDHDDNPGATPEEAIAACAAKCIQRGRSTLDGLKGFEIIPSTGRCWCTDADALTCTVIGKERHDGTCTTRDNGRGYERFDFVDALPAPHPTCATAAGTNAFRTTLNSPTGTPNVPTGTGCVFPFHYRGKLYNGCADYSNDGHQWCATTSDYDADGEWGICDSSAEAACPDNTPRTSGVADNSLCHAGFQKGYPDGPDVTEHKFRYANGTRMRLTGAQCAAKVKAEIPDWSAWCVSNEYLQPDADGGSCYYYLGSFDAANEDHIASYGYGYEEGNYVFCPRKAEDGDAEADDDLSSTSTTAESSTTSTSSAEPVPTITYDHYEILKGGETCESKGHLTIWDVDECQLAGATLSGNLNKGFRFDQPEGGYTISGTSRTKGCTFHGGNVNNDLQHFPNAQGACGTANFHCVCGVIAAASTTITATTESSTTPTSSSSTSTSSAEPVPTMFVKAHAGKDCESAHIIRTAQLCKQAAAEVGRPYSKTVYDEVNRPLGCFHDQNGAMYFNNFFDETANRAYAVDSGTVGWKGVAGMCTILPQTTTTTTTTIKCNTVGVDDDDDGDDDSSDAAACVFPFVYKGVSYNGCTEMNNVGIPWCATTSSYDNDKQWGVCKSESCPMEVAKQHPTCTTHKDRDDVAAKPGDTCVFPFIYKGKEYYGCTEDDYEGKPWCATSPNYDEEDYWWGLCDLGSNAACPMEVDGVVVEYPTTTAQAVITTAHAATTTAAPIVTATAETPPFGLVGEIKSKQNQDVGSVGILEASRAGQGDDASDAASQTAALSGSSIAGVLIGVIAIAIVVAAVVVQQAKKHGNATIDPAAKDAKIHADMESDGIGVSATRRNSNFIMKVRNSLTTPVVAGMHGSSTRSSSALAMVDDVPVVSARMSVQAQDYLVPSMDGEQLYGSANSIEESLYDDIANTESPAMYDYVAPSMVADTFAAAGVGGGEDEGPVYSAATAGAALGDHEHNHAIAPEVGTGEHDYALADEISGAADTVYFEEPQYTLGSNPEDQTGAESSFRTKSVHRTNPLSSIIM